MGKLVVTEFVSLDGVMQAPGGEDFKYPGWSFDFDRGEDGNEFKLRETLETDVVLVAVGRRPDGRPGGGAQVDTRVQPHVAVDGVDPVAVAGGDADAGQRVGQPAARRRGRRG